MGSKEESGITAIPGLIIDDLKDSEELGIEAIEEVLIILRFKGQAQPIVIDVTNEPAVVNAILVNLNEEEEKN